MHKMILAFFVVTLLVLGIIQTIPQIPKEMMYTYIKKSFSVLVALVVASGIIFVFVQLF